MLCLVVGACGSPLSRRPEQIHGIVEGVAADAWQLARGDQPMAALRAARAVDRVDPERDLETSVRAQLSPEALARAERPGAWRGMREPQERPLWERAALWLPDRVLDVFDLISLEFDLGVGLRVDAHITQYLPLMLGESKGVGVGWHPERSLGLALFQRSNSLGYERYLALAGTRSGLVASGSSEHLPDENAPYYADLGDRWGVGLNAHLVLVGASVEVHPLQFWDLLAGFVGFDPWDDDTARTRPFEPSQQMRLRFEAIHEVLLDASGREAYLAWNRKRAADEAGEPAPQP
ncbi:MAG: hypothetical protein DHS20C15_10310 [Planctomycetota bacterium]|nr:MAG: hypothetical protein DHS20C15_10310 [Planctomycetota bacterium]